MTTHVDKMIARLSEVMTHLGFSFTLKGQPLPYTEVFASSGMMPPIAKRADQLCALCLGYGIGVKFKPDKTTKTGSSVEFDEQTPDVLRELCLIDTIIEVSKAATNKHAIRLDELLYD